MLDTPRDVVRCLITYTDWYQPSTASVMAVGKARPDRNLSDGLNPGIIETIDERMELCRRVTQLDERERLVLFLFYVTQLHIDDVAARVGISRRQFFRVKQQAIKRLITQSSADEAA